MSLKITILGCGSAYGVPVIGGDWGDCNPDNPRNRRLAPSILVENDDTRILIDMGPDIRPQAERHSIRKLDAILFTHPHADHITGNFHLPMMMRYYSDSNLYMYATRACRKEIEKVWWFQHDPKISVEYSGNGRPLWTEIRSGYKFKVGSIEILPLLHMHGKMEAMTYRIGNFAYTTDASEIPDHTLSKLAGLDTWIVECNCLVPTNSHSYPAKTLEWINHLKPAKAYLTHLDHTMDYDKVSAMLPENVHLCYDDLILRSPLV